MSRPSNFVAPHKALRSFFSSTLTRAGNTDHTHAEQVRQLIAQCRELFGLLHIHATNENNILLARLDERAPGSGDQDLDDHDELAEMQVDLEQQLDLLETVGASPESLEVLYTGLGKFFSMHLEHMYDAEMLTQKLLWHYFSDEELAAMRVQVIKQLKFDQLMVWFKHMFPAMRPQERAGMLVAFLGSAPPPVAEKATAVIRAALGDAEWDRTRSLIAANN